MKEIHRPLDVRVDNAFAFEPILIEEGVAECAPGVREKSFDRTVECGNSGVKRVSAVFSGKIGLDGANVGSKTREVRGRVPFLSSSAANTRSKPFRAASRARLYPIPEEAPVTTASGRLPSAAPRTTSHQRL